MLLGPSHGLKAKSELVASVLRVTGPPSDENREKKRFNIFESSMHTESNTYISMHALCLATHCRILT